jgi:hypothetical protein
LTFWHYESGRREAGEPTARHYLLEDDLELWLVNARHVQTVAGRKTDVQEDSRKALGRPGDIGDPIRRPSPPGSDATEERAEPRQVRPLLPQRPVC